MSRAVRRERLRGAIHEASHVIVALELGWPIGSAELRAGGGGRVVPDTPASDRHTGDAPALMAFLLAGYVGEEVRFGGGVLDWALRNVTARIERRPLPRRMFLTSWMRRS